MPSKKSVVSGRRKVINVVPSDSVFTAITDICDSFRIDKTTFVNTVLVLYLHNPTWFGYVDHALDPDSAKSKFKEMMANLPSILSPEAEQRRIAAEQAQVDANYERKFNGMDALAMVHEMEEEAKARAAQPPSPYGAFGTPANF